jgi:hypothetical protein
MITVTWSQFSFCADGRLGKFIADYACRLHEDCLCGSLKVLFPCSRASSKRRAFVNYTGTINANAIIAHIPTLA